VTASDPGRPNPAKPLSALAKKTLRSLLTAPVPRQEINAGLCWKLEEGGLVETCWLPNPYKTKRGTVRYLRITDAGRRMAEGER